MSVFPFLGIIVNALTIDDLHLAIKNIIQNNDKGIISHHNLHSLYLFHHDFIMRKFYNQSNLVHIDGMSLVFLGRFLGHPLEKKHRVTYIDWVRPLMQEALREGWKVFFLGSRPGVAAKAAAILQSEISGLQLETRHGYFDETPGSEENQKVLQSIAEYQPNLLMVGMGMPRQEHWVLANLSKIQANVILTCGACMDYVAKESLTPPRWMGPLGLEWLYRLFKEPVRLWRRYLLEPWFILKLLFKEIL